MSGAPRPRRARWSITIVATLLAWGFPLLPSARADVTCSRDGDALSLVGSADLSLARDPDGLILADGAALSGGCEGATVEDVAALRVETVGRVALDLANGGFRRSDGTTVPIALSAMGTADTLAVLGTSEPEDLLIGGVGADLTGDGTPDVSGLETVETVELRLGSGDDEAGLRGGGDLGSPWGGPTILEGADGDDTLLGGEGPDHLIGGAGDDDLQGGSGEDRFDASDAADGMDLLIGGPGDDTADYGARTERVSLLARQPDASGERGEGDTLIGIETLIGGAGPDVLIGVGMNETLIGGGGNDRISGGSGYDVLLGGGGDDVLRGDREDDRLRGGGGRDLLIGGDGADRLSGQADDDRLRGGPGRDGLHGGPGSDTASFADALGPVAVDLAGGSVSGAAGRDLLTGVEHVVGSPFADVIAGDHRANRLIAGRGRDDLAGGRGDDLLDGGRGIDRGDGGAGSDRCRHVERAVSCSLGPASAREGLDGATLPRVLDPTLTWNTFLGGGGEDYVAAVAKEPTGGSYVVGTSTASWGSPLRAFGGGGADGFVARVDARGSVLWNTFLGGAGQDVASDVAVLPDGSIAVSGWSDQPWGTPVREHRGGADGFVALLDAAGALRTLSFVGGPGRDRLAGVAPSPDGSSVVAVGTSSRSWGSPLAPFIGGTDVSVVDVRRTGTLRWSTFLGGPGDDEGAAVVAAADAIVVTGSSSAGFGSPIRPFGGGDRDALLAAFDASGALRWTSFLGGAGIDHAASVAARADGGVLVGGRSTAPWGEPDRAFSGHADGFVAVLGSGGDLERSSFLGGSGWDRVDSVGADASGNAFATGRSSASWGSPRRAHAGGDDAFLALLGEDGDVPWLTFLGGDGNDAGVDLTFAAQAVFAAGISDAAWGEPIRAFRGGWTDGFVAAVPMRTMDATIAHRPRGPYLGRGIFNTTGYRQTLRDALPTGARGTFSVRVWNDGVLPDGIRFAGCSPSPGFGVRYFRGSTEVTEAVRDGTLTSPTLPPGGGATLRVEILVKRAARVGDVTSCRIAGSSVASPRARDVVRVVVRVAPG